MQIFIYLFNLWTFLPNLTAGAKNPTMLAQRLDFPLWTIADKLLNWHSPFEQRPIPSPV
jgi:hypothetical protein